MRRAIAAAWGIVVAGAGAGATPAPLGAQMLGVPVVQSPFSGQAILFGVNGGMTDADDETLAAALALKPPVGRGLALTLGAGWLWGGGDGSATYGGRLSFLLPLGRDQRFAMAPFIGVGGLRADSVSFDAELGEDAPPITYSLVNAPVGVSVGWRYPLGVDRAIAMHGALSWQAWRFTLSGAGALRNTYTRIGIGVDVALTTRLGVSAAWEGGRTAEAGEIGPTQSIWGLGIAYVVK